MLDLVQLSVAYGQRVPKLTLEIVKEPLVLIVFAIALAILSLLCRMLTARAVLLPSTLPEGPLCIRTYKQLEIIATDSLIYTSILSNHVQLNTRQRNHEI